MILALQYSNVWMNRKVRRRGTLVPRSAGSDLILALSKADQPGKALRVYEDMMSTAWGFTSTQAMRRRKQPESTGHAGPLQSDPGGQALARSAASHSETAEAPADQAEQIEGDAPAFQSVEDPTSHGIQAAEQQHQHASDSRAAADNTQPKRPRNPPQIHRHSTGSTGAGDRDVSSQADVRGGKGEAQPSKRQQQQAGAKQQLMVIPHVAALGALVGALARANIVDKALELYAQV